jgi:hypothetical protein
MHATDLECQWTVEFEKTLDKGTLQIALGKHCLAVGQWWSEERRSKHQRQVAVAHLGLLLVLRLSDFSQELQQVLDRVFVVLGQAR